ncbi:MAG: DnaJ domain-containing protein [Deltaproteobacteria bacterium]|nr:DnaJ domain-containing protein [Deltaproteobacteria bacterium]
MARPTQDFYSILESPPDATPERLRAAYTRLAKKYHPDLNPHKPEAAELFKRVTEAYAVLRDAESRARYDRLRNKLKTAFERAQKAKTAAKTAAKTGPNFGPNSSPEPGRFSHKRPTSPNDSKSGKGPKTSESQSARKDEAPKKTSVFTEPLKGGPKAQANSGAKPNGAGPAKKAGERPESSPKRGPTAAKVDHEPLKDNPPKPDPAALKATNKSAARPNQGWAFKGPKSKDSKDPKAERPTRIPTEGLFSRVKKLARQIFTKPLAPFSEESSSDIVYRIAISPLAAKTGTTVSISYLRDANQPQRLEIHIPPGVKDQAQLRLAGQGNLGPNQTRGDLVLNVSVMG